MAYLVEYTLSTSPETMRAVVVDSIGGCTSEELTGEVCRAASRIITRPAHMHSFSWYQNRASAEPVAHYCYPKPRER